MPLLATNKEWVKIEANASPDPSVVPAHLLGDLQICCAAWQLSTRTFPNKRGFQEHGIKAPMQGMLLLLS